MEVPLEQCRAVRSFLDESGPIVGLPALQCHYRQVPRVVLDEILCSFRDRWRQEHRRVICELEWDRPGAIWAMDFTHPPRLIDGVFPAILNVVDLGSRQQLCWLPVMHEDSATIQDVLRNLFEEHGAPLVIKSDNGPAFRAEASKEMLSDWGVFPLFSPPYCASYNGVCERANQTMKLMTAHVAERAGRGHWWRSEDLEEARSMANEVRRPWGASGPSPQEKWAARNVAVTGRTAKHVARNRETPRAASRGKRDRPAGDPLALRSSGDRSRRGVTGARGARLLSGHEEAIYSSHLTPCSGQELWWGHKLGERKNRRLNVGRICLPKWLWNRGCPCHAGRRILVHPGEARARLREVDTLIPIGVVSKGSKPGGQHVHQSVVSRVSHPRLQVHTH